MLRINYILALLWVIIPFSSAYSASIEKKYANKADNIPVFNNVSSNLLMAANKANADLSDINGLSASGTQSTKAQNNYDYSLKVKHNDLFSYGPTYSPSLQADNKVGYVFGALMPIVAIQGSQHLISHALKAKPLVRENVSTDREMNSAGPTAVSSFITFVGFALMIFLWARQINKIEETNSQS